MEKCKDGWVKSDEVCPKCGTHTEVFIYTIDGVEHITGERCPICKWCYEEE